MGWRSHAVKNVERKLISCKKRSDFLFLRKVLRMLKDEYDVAKMKTLLIAVLCAICGAHAWAQSASGETKYIGRAGDVFIPEDEFLHRFEMLPALYRHRLPKVNEAKLEFLYSMIAEKLLAQEAVARGLDRDSVYLNAMSSMRRMLGRDELYREDILGKVTVSDAEIRHAVAEAQRQLLVAYIYCERQEDADFLRGQIKGARDFDRLQMDSTMLALRDTATIVWGEAEAPIERAAFALKRGEVSPVVTASTGFYIMKVVRVQLSGTFASLPPETLRERVIDKLKKRKQEGLAEKFVPEVMRDKVGYSKPEPFKMLAHAMIDVLSKEKGDTLVFLNDVLAHRLKAACAPVLADTFAVAGDTYWTTEQVIDLLNAKQFHVHRDRLRSVPRMLNDDMRYWVQQELLGQEALSRGLDRVPSVQRDLEMWSQSDLAGMMKRYVGEHTTVTDAEAWSYLKSQDRNLTLPRVKLRELRTHSLTEMGQALADLEKGKSFEEVIAVWSNDPVARANKGVTPPFAISDRPPVGQIAWDMDVGQRYGPLVLGDGVLYFQLLAKDSSGATADTSLAMRLSRARAEVFRMKQKRTVTLLIAKAAKDRGYAIFEDRLKQLEVSPVPMMTFRFLGFGGRIFAVPFVDPQLDWIGVEPPASEVLP